MEESVNYAWSFPCYILLGEHNVDPITGAPIFHDEYVRFIDPDVAPPENERHIAIFTDIDLAESFLRTMKLTDSFRPFPFRSPEELRRFLATARQAYQHVVMDMVPGRFPHRSFDIDEVIQALNLWSGPPGFGQ